jgi:tetratricopeptide (TPR) repeat protein
MGEQGDRLLARAQERGDTVDGVIAWDTATGDFGWREDMPLPAALKGRFASEPKWVDLTAYRDGADKRDAKFTELAADFAAAIRGMPKEDLLSQEVRQQHRALTLAWSAAGLLLVLTVAATGAGFLAYRAQQEATSQRDAAEKAKNEANAQRDRAEHNLTLATDTATKTVIELADRFADVGLPAPLAKDILDRALALQDQLIGGGELSWELGMSQFQALASTVRTLAKLGDPDGALAAAKKMHAIVQSLPAVLPQGAAATPEFLAMAPALDAEIAGLLVNQGRFDDALALLRDAIATTKALTTKTSGTGAFHDHLQFLVWTSSSGLARILLAQGKLDEALATYREGNAILKALVANDASKSLWQTGLAISNWGIGDVLKAQGKVDEALAAYRESLAIYEMLAAKEPRNTSWQHAVSVVRVKVGEALTALGRLAEALAGYRDGLPVIKSLVAQDPSNAEHRMVLRGYAEGIGNLAYLFVLARDFATALEAADQGIALAPDLIFQYGNRAHALMFLGRVDEARAIYLQYRGAKVVQSNKAWEVVTLEDFAELRKAGLTHPLMDEIEKQFAARG